MLPKAGLTVCHYAINFQDTGVGRKERVVLFWMPATRGECRLVSKNQLPIAAQETKVFKGEFQGGMDRGRGQEAAKLGIPANQAAPGGEAGPTRQGAPGRGPQDLGCPGKSLQERHLLPGSARMAPPLGSLL